MTVCVRACTKHVQIAGPRAAKYDTIIHHGHDEIVRSQPSLHWTQWKNVCPAEPSLTLFDMKLQILHNNQSQ